MNILLKHSPRREYRLRDGTLVACQQALSVAHLWNMPRIVREYLETQDESKRAAACAAANTMLTKMVMKEHKKNERRTSNN